MKKRISVCFVDDDRAEVERFRECLQHRYTIGAGLTLRDALAELRDVGIRAPDLILLDLYYGPVMKNAAKQEAITAADEELSKMERKVQELLNDAGQSPNEGFELARVVKETHPRVPVAFFSRKAFLKDALRAEEMGLPVLEKPDPQDTDLEKPDPFEAALKRNADEIARRIDKMVDLNTWWVRNGEWIRGFAQGLFFFLLGLAWEVWKIDASQGTRLVLEGMLICAMVSTLVLAWLKHS